MLVKLQQAKQELGHAMPAQTSMTDHSIKLNRMAVTNRNHEEGKRLIDGMKAVNDRHDHRSMIMRSKSQALIQSTDSYIMAERSHRNDPDHDSQRADGVFALTNPSDGGPAWPIKSTQVSLPYIGMTSPRPINQSIATKKAIQGQHAGRQLDIIDRLHHDIDDLKSRKAMLLNNNRDAIKDEYDANAGKQHKRIKIDRLLHRPLYMYDQSAVDVENHENTRQPTDSHTMASVEAYSRKYVDDDTTNDWMACKVITRVAPGKYVIEWVDDNKRKIVDRLNLRFYSEIHNQRDSELDQRYTIAVSKQYEDLFARNLDGSLCIIQDVLSNLDIGNNRDRVPQQSITNIQSRLARSTDQRLQMQFMMLPAARLPMIEFEAMYSQSIKKFIYISMINDYEADQISSWVDANSYTRTQINETSPEVYYIESIDESPGNEQNIHLTVETRVSLNKSEGIDLTSTFLDNGYALPKTVEREAKIAKFLYKHRFVVAERQRGQRIVQGLQAMINRHTSKQIRMHQTKIALKIHTHFCRLADDRIVDDEVINGNLALKNADKLKSWMSDANVLHGNGGD